MDKILETVKNGLNNGLVFRIINIIVGCFMIIGGVCVIITGGFPQFIRGIYCIVFGAMVFLFEFRLPPIITQHVSYMFSFLGRGLFYIFIGCIILNYLPLAIASGVIVAVFGVMFTILQFVPGVEPPSNMKRDAFDSTLSSGGGGGGVEGGRAAHWAAHSSPAHDNYEQNYYGHSAADTGFDPHADTNRVGPIV